MAKIAVIEDDPQISRMVVKLLSKAGHQVLCFATGEEGLTTALAEPPDLMLIDLGLPDIDGQTVIALLRQQANMAKTPLIAFTAWPQDTAFSMAKAYQCDGVITKPIDTRTFVKQVEAFIAGS